MRDDDVRGGAETLGPGTGASDRKAEARRRLAEALRANLRRRKASRPSNDPADGAASPSRGAQTVDDEQVAGKDSAGKDAAGKDMAGRDVAGQDMAGRDMAARDVNGGDRG